MYNLIMYICFLCDFATFLSQNFEVTSNSEKVNSNRERNHIGSKIKSLFSLRLRLPNSLIFKIGSTSFFASVFVVFTFAKKIHYLHFWGK